MSTQINEIHRSRPLLGTFVEITATDASKNDRETAVDAAFDAIELVHRLMSFHDSNSDVSRLNQEAWKYPVIVHPWTYCVLKTAIDLHNRSAGIFDIAIASALQSLNILPGTPYGEVVSASSASIILLPDCRVRFSHPKVRIDLGGIAKGFAVDQAVTILRERGITRGLVNAGGDMFAFGRPAYRAYIRNPYNPSQLMSQIELRDEALATSGNRFDPLSMVASSESSIIDSRVGIPVNRIVGVSIRASSCMMADALTKFVMIEGESSTSMLDFYCASALFVSVDGNIRITGNWRVEDDIPIDEFEKVVN